MARKRRRLTEEQLSMVLGEHSVGQLVSCGAENWGNYWDEPGKNDYPIGCVSQVAFNYSSNNCVPGPEELVNKFDTFYDGAMTVEELLQLVDHAF